MPEDRYNPHDIHTLPYDFTIQGKHEGDIGQTVLEKLESIHTVLQGIHRTLTAPGQEEAMDERFVQLLFKSGMGANWIPNHRGKFYIYVYAPVATALNITSPLGPPFVLTIPAPTFPNIWNLFDIPDQSSVILDATASANQMNIFVLLTDRKL